MKERSRNIMVGLTTLAGLCGLAGLLLLFGKVPQWLRPAYRMQFQFVNAGGLNTASRVKLNGIDIGKVVNLELATPPDRGVRATAEIDHHIRLPQATLAFIRAPLLGGSPTLALETQTLTDAELADLLPTDGTALLTGKEGSMLSTFSDQLDRTVTESVKALRSDLNRALDGFDSIKADFHHLSTQWTSVGQNVNQLLEPRDPAAVERGDVPANLTTVLARADGRLAELKTALAGLNQVLGDEKLLTDVRTTVSQMRDASGNAKELTAKLNQQSEQLTTRLVALADDLSKTLAGVNKLTEQARAGDGTMGKLLNDPALFNNLNDAVQRISAAADEIRLLAQKWKAEGLPVRF